MDLALDELISKLEKREISRSDAIATAIELRDGCISSTEILRKTGNIYRWLGFVDKLNHIEFLINEL